MSRTWNTAPWQVQEQRLIARGERWRLSGYPARIGGCQEHRAEVARRFEAQLRGRVRADLYHGREPPRKVVRCVRWWIW